MSPEVKVVEAEKCSSVSNLDVMEPVFITNSFKSKSEALKQSVIYVFCPPESAERIGSIIDDYSFDIVINDYSIHDCYSLKIY